jgi:hypothetical protein
VVLFLEIQSGSRLPKGNFATGRVLRFAQQISESESVLDTGGMPVSAQQVTEIKAGTHAHYCAFCASQGVETIWAHGNENAGNLAGHRCPRCGHVEWVKTAIQSGALPQAATQAAQQPNVLAVVTLNDAVISCIIYAIGLLALVYGVLFLYKKFFAKQKVV